MTSPTTPSRERLAALTIEVSADAPPSATAIGIPVATDGAGDAVAGLAVGRERADGCGFRRQRWFGARRRRGERGDDDRRRHRGRRSGRRHGAAQRRRGVRPRRQAARRARLLARGHGRRRAGARRPGGRGGHRPRPLPLRPAARLDKGTAVAAITIVAPAADEAAVRAGAVRGSTFAAVTALARDLANSPHSHLTASDIADLAVDLGAQAGPRGRGVRQGRPASSWAAAACSASTRAAPSRRG